jgi:hypothetical protein
MSTTTGPNKIAFTLLPVLVNYNEKPLPENFVGVEY